MSELHEEKIDDIFSDINHIPLKLEIRILKKYRYVSPCSTRDYTWTTFMTHQTIYNVIDIIINV